MENIQIEKEQGELWKISNYLIIDEACKMIVVEKISEEEFIDTLDWLQNLLEYFELEYDYFFNEQHMDPEKLKDLYATYLEGIDIYKKAISELEYYLEDWDQKRIKNGLAMALEGNESLLKVQELTEEERRQLTGMERSYKTAGSPPDYISQSSLASSHREYLLVKEKLEKSNKKSEIMSLIPLFSVLGEEEIEKLSKRIRLKKYDKGNVLFNEGDISDELHIVKSGEINLYKLYREEIKDLICLYKGEVFGEMGIIMNSPRSLSARVTSDTAELYVISRSDFLYMLYKYPELSLNLSRILCERLKERGDVLIDHIAEHMD